MPLAPEDRDQADEARDEAEHADENDQVRNAFEPLDTYSDGYRVLL